MEKKEHISLFSRFKSGLGIWLCFFCAFLLPLSVFASNKGLVGHWLLNERSEAVGDDLIGSLDLTTEWLPAGSGVVLDNDTFTTSVSNVGGLYKPILTIGKQYRCQIAGTTTATAFRVRNRGTTSIYSPALSGTFSEVFDFVATADDGLYLRNGVSEVSETTITHLRVKEVVTADATPNNNNGSVLNGPTYTAGRDGKGLGEEVLTNGTFDADSDWTHDGSWSISAGKAMCTGDGTNQYLIQDNDRITKAGKYKIRYEVTENSLVSSATQLALSSSSVFDYLSLNSTVGTHVIELESTNLSGEDVRFFVHNTSTSGTISIDNVSIREIVSGQAMEFDGVDDYVSITNNEVLNPTSAITLSAWIKPFDITTNTYYEIIRQDPNASNRKIFSFQDNGTKLTLGLQTGGAYWETDTPITASEFTDGNWHHVVALYDSELLKARVYKDGVLLEEENHSGIISSTSAAFFIGSAHGSSEFFNGSISDVRIYDRALTATEIEQLYSGSGASTASTGSLNKGLVGHWPLNTESKKSATVIADTTPYNNNGTLSGAEVRNHGYYFDGVDDVITTSGISGTTDELTQVYWVKKDSLTSGIRRFSDLNPYQCGFSSSSFFAHTTSSSGSDINLPYGTVTGFTAGEWHMVVVTRETHTENQTKLYLDGELKLTGNLVNAANGMMTLRDFPISYASATQAWDGNIADVRLYDRVLSATEITNLYNGADIPGAIGYWPLASGAGDVSGNGNNGIVNGATLIGEAASFGGGVGSGDMINLENPLEIDLTSFALGFWVKRDSLISADATNTSSFLRILEEGQYFKFLDYGISGGKFKFHGERDQNSAYWASVTTTVDADTEWHYVFISGDNNVVDVYMDGVYQGTDDDSAAGYTSNICTISSIGKGYSAANASYGSYFAGEIKDLKYYDRPLSATEVATLYDQGHSKQKQATIGNLNKGLVGHWPLKSAYEKTGENMLANFSFETGDMTSWTNGSADYSVVTDEVKYGKYSLKGVHDGSIEKPMAGQSFSVEIGKTYVISAWIKSDLTAGMHYLTTENAIGGTIEKSITGTTDWTFVQKTGTATTTTLNVYVYPHGYPIGTTWTDNISVKEVNLTADTTPQSNHGYVYGATVASGYTAFDGSDYISTQLHLPITKDFTFSAWVNKTSNIERNTIIGSWSPWIWHIHDQEVQFETYIGSIESHVSASTAVPYNTWTHLAMEYIYANDAIRFYINGSFDNEVILSGKLDPSSKNIYLGGYPDWRFHGSLNNIRVYNRTLSDREVKMLYDKGR